jgi:hypothetical protein
MPLTCNTSVRNIEGDEDMVLVLAKIIAEARGEPDAYQSYIGAAYRVCCVVYPKEN